MPDGPVVVYDGVCALCNGWVAFVLRLDRAGVFLFASFDSEWARARKLQSDARPPGSILLVSGSETYQKSDAVLAILGQLPNRLVRGIAKFTSWTPRPVRDWVYDRVAAVRYSIFGRTTVCPLLPTPLRRRFLP